VSERAIPWKTLTKLGVFALVAVLFTVVVTASLLNLSSAPTTPYQALFTDASGLQPGDFVDIAGVKVGTVTGVRLSGLRALVNFNLDANQRLTDTTHVNIDYANLLGQQLLELSPGAKPGRRLAAGSLIPTARTAPALDLTSVFNGFQPLFNALSPQQVNDLTASIIAVFQGESGTIGSLVNQTTALTSNLVQHQALIGDVVDNLTKVAGTLGTHNQQLVTLVDQFDSLVTGLAGERDQIGSTVDSLSGLSSAVAGLLTQSQPSLDQSITGLVSASHAIAGDQQQIDGVLTGLPAFITTLDKISNSGSYLSVYICDLTINVQGTANLNVVTGIPDVPITFPSGPVGDQSQHTANCK
jgi:phospholipid/cholesterol/gamma-HCH transport system substrate-binding protein